MDPVQFKANFYEPNCNGGFYFEQLCSFFSLKVRVGQSQGHSATSTGGAPRPCGHIWKPPASGSSGGGHEVAFASESIPSRGPR